MCVLTVGVVCGRGVVRRRSGVGVVTPVVAGVADHPGYPGAPRRRLQRRPRRLVPSSGARLAAHVHRVRRNLRCVSQPLVEEERESGGPDGGEGKKEGWNREKKEEREKEKERRGGRGAGRARREED